MKTYVTTKLVTAEPMTRRAYAIYRGDNPDKYPEPSEAGYLVKDPEDQLETNFGLAGPSIWVPERKFIADYRTTQNMNFSNALTLVKNGFRVQRAGWNGKGMFIFLVKGSTFKVNRPPLLGIYPEGTEIKYHGHIDMKTADDIVVPWLCSQTDMLAEDWMLYVEKAS